LRYGSKRVEPEMGYAFPGLHVLGMTILVAIVYIIFLPYFKDKALAYLVGFILGIWLIATSVACIYLGQLHVSDITGALTLGFAWVYYCSNLYIRYAAKLKKIKGFRNSNY
jgi:membrane-associated phospholipid phosphatase